MRDTSRIDTELTDIAYLANAGARVAVLSHQGRHKDGSALHLDGIADYLGRKLGRTVLYIPENTTDAAISASLGLEPGVIAVFGNTRHHSGEEAGDLGLAARFARLGDAVAIGGFSKAHRGHASNVGLLSYLPGWAAQSLTEEIQRLAPWSGTQSDLPSLAVLGGVKPEKTLIGLRSFSQAYDVVVPGGAVLNHVLHQSGFEIGDSELGDDPARCAAVTDEVLTQARARIHIPSRVIVAQTVHGFYQESYEIDISDGVPRGFGIVDFRLEPWLLGHMGKMGEQGGRAVIAGTPCVHRKGFRKASGALLHWASQPSIDAILMGGDTTSELPFAGPTSTGGGSALCYLGEADLPVLKALRENATQTWQAIR
ncbi:phosphoglycerate kinase [Streptomyces sp. NPDC053728]|uniref:phosphoglycerate kinase n=1 Tax=Streptomyces sp. NPDC053728 TaxID=3155534 RepID=UPI003442D2E3